jgi:hypothetical protein
MATGNSATSDARQQLGNAASAKSATRWHLVFSVCGFATLLPRLILAAEPIMSAYNRLVQKIAEQAGKVPLSLLWVLRLFSCWIFGGAKAVQVGEPLWTGAKAAVSGTWNGLGTGIMAILPKNPAGMLQTEALTMSNVFIQSRRVSLR